MAIFEKRLKDSERTKGHWSLADGWATIRQAGDGEGDSWVKLKFETRRRGPEGTAYGAFAFTLYRDNEEVFKKTKFLTVGAQLDGSATKRWSRDYEWWSGGLFGANGATLKVSISERNIFDDAGNFLRDWKNNVLDDIKGLGVSDIASLAAGNYALGGAELIKW